MLVVRVAEALLMVDWTQVHRAVEIEAACMLHSWYRPSLKLLHRLVVKDMLFVLMIALDVVEVAQDFPLQASNNNSLAVAGDVQQA